eukprot:gene28128-10920_t
MGGGYGGDSGGMGDPAMMGTMDPGMGRGDMGMGGGMDPMGGMGSMGMMYAWVRHAALNPPQSWQQTMMQDGIDE